VLCSGHSLVSTENTCPGSDVEILSEVFSLCLNITFDPIISLITFQQIISNFSNNLPIDDYYGHDFTIYYKRTYDIVAYAIIRIFVHKNKRSYNTVIKDIRQQLAIDLFTEINGQNIRVAQRVGDYCDFSTTRFNSSDALPSSIKFLRSRDQHFLESIVNVSEFIVERMHIGGGISPKLSPPITKLSFCRQVELGKHEATVIGDRLLYVNLTGRLVFDFVATHDPFTADVRVRICLEDFPYDELRLSSSSLNGLARLLFCTLVVSLWYM